MLRKTPIMVSLGRQAPLALLNNTMRTMTTSSAPSRERLRVAIVGGGVGGLSAALHLSSLVEEGKIASPVDVYQASPAPLRDIGVGIWSTALRPFQRSWRSSHQLVWEDFLHVGRWVDRVGYRAPSGAWLAKSELSVENTEFPSLLFLRERDLVESLRKGVHLEALKGTVQIHQGSRVLGVQEDYTQLYSAPLRLKGAENPTERDYHLIICADGTNSVMRKRYGGHRRMPRITGSTALGDSGRDDDDGETSAYDPTQAHPNYDSSSHEEANAIEDRGYTVFRGNADLSIQETGMDGVSFQTWGEGDMMRFATVPLSYPTSEGRKEKQVWFATTSLEGVLNEVDPIQRKNLLLASFSHWHDPVARLMEATPPEDIIVDRAVAHRHSAGPVRDVRGILADVYNSPPPSAGPGPALGFLGDAFMTVDPILAQGFTLAMESGAELAASVEASCAADEIDGEGSIFDPKLLRRHCQRRNDQRSSRLVHMLRATDVVQALGQPQSGLIGLACRYLIRPAMQVTPDFVKTPVFNAMLNYSLGISVNRN